MVSPIRLGMVGINEGNGHPYSFAAIINGFNDEAMGRAGWDFIHNYLRCRHPSEFGFENVQVTHVWTQDPEETTKIAQASNIVHTVANVEDMMDHVDGVIIARDDYQTHLPLAKPFLEQGKCVFIDKPLSVDIDDLRFFRPYLESGQLMSCAAARYAKELDEIRGNINRFGQMKLIRGTVVNNMDKYGIHMLDGILGVTGFQAHSVSCVEARHTSMRVRNRDGSLMYIDALGETPKTLQIDFWSDTNRFHAEVIDNFSMFRRLLADFIQMMRTRTPPIDPALVIDSMKVLIAARRSKEQDKEILIDDITV